LERDLMALHQNEVKEEHISSSNFSFHGMTGSQLRMFYVRDSSNRGPWAMRGHMLRTLGFLDEVRRVFSVLSIAVLCCGVRSLGDTCTSLLCL
jgi:hypothetical protein